MQFFRLPALAVASLLALPAFAQQETRAADIDRLYDALGLPELIVIMQEEGIAYGDELAAEMLPDRGRADWQEVVAAIYDFETMQEEVRGAFAEAIIDSDLESMLDFFTSERGAQIIDLEISARRAMLDDGIEEASREAAALQMMDETPRYEAVTAFIQANDLIESNVVGALNSSYAFYMGLIDGGVMPAGVTAETALQDVWAQEPDIRNNTTEWIYAFLLLAYQPLSDDDLAAYQAFSETQAGEELNSALFMAFDEMFVDISRALGLAASRFMVTQEL